TRRSSDLETASNAGGAGKAATSEATAVVLLAVPVSTAPPTITGEARQGQTLTEHNGTWTNSPTSFSYQWLQCSALGGSCLPISGATKQTYVPALGDVGHTLRVEETASNAGGAGKSGRAEWTASVTPEVGGASNTSPPTITGTAKQGQTLTEVHGSWTNSPTSYAYQWLQCNGEGTLASCTPISGATKQEYAPVEGDVGHKLRVEETASNAGGAGNAATSEATAVVLPAVPSSTTPATITDAARQGQTLTEHR